MKYFLFIFITFFQIAISTNPTFYTKAIYNISKKGFGECYSSKDCSYSGACISNHYGFNIIDDYQFQYKRANGEIKTKHWLEIGTVAVGSPAWNAGIRTGYNIEGIDGVLDDNAPTASKRLVKAVKSTIKVYLRKKEEADGKALRKKLKIQYGTRYNVTLNKTSPKESFGLKFSERNGTVHILKVFNNTAASRVGLINKYDQIKMVGNVTITNTSKVKDIIKLFMKKMIVNLTLRRPHLHEYPDTIPTLKSSKKKKYHFTAVLEKNYSVKLGECVCRGYMTGRRCTSVHIGKELTAIDPVRGVNETKAVIVRSLSNEFVIFTFIISMISTLMLFKCISIQIFHNSKLNDGRNKISLTLYVNDKFNQLLDFLYTIVIVPGLQYSKAYIYENGYEYYWKIILKPKLEPKFDEIVSRYNIDLNYWHEYGIELWSQSEELWFQFLTDAYYYKTLNEDERGKNNTDDDDDDKNKFINVSFTWGTLAKVIILWSMSFVVKRQAIMSKIEDASIIYPSQATWGSSLIKTCNTYIDDSNNQDKTCLYHQFIHEFDKNCKGTFYDCAGLVHTVSDVGPIGPFERMNYTFLPPGHPSSDVLRIRADQHIVVASVYANDGMTRNLTFCNNYPLTDVLKSFKEVVGSMNVILSDEEKLQDEDTSPNKQNDNKAQTMACDNVGCVYSASTKRCTIRANVDVNGDERIGPSELKSYGHPFDYSDANHNYRTSKQGQQFDLYTSSNVDGVNGTTNWTKFEGIFKSRHDESGDFWDQYIGDPSLTLLNNGSIILLYRGWKKGKEHESKIGIASTTDWRKEPFHRIGKDGILLQSKYANQSYGEPTLHVDAKGYVHVYFRSKPAVTCPSEILHAFGTVDEINSGSLNLDLKMPYIGCTKASKRQFYDAKGKIRNGMDRKLLHPDEVLEYGRPKIFSIGDKYNHPVSVAFSVVRHNADKPRLLKYTKLQKMLHWGMYKLGFSPYYYETEPYPPLTRTLMFDVIQGVQGVVVDEDSY